MEAAREHARRVTRRNPITRRARELERLVLQGELAEFERAMRDLHSMPSGPWSRDGRHEGSTVGIYCPGPSLARCERVAREDVLIAVNTAIGMVDADWLACYDRACLMGLQHLPRLGLLTKAGHADGVKRLAGLEVVEMHAGVSPPEAEAASWRHTTTGALCLAAWLGASRIVMHGDDKEGREYHDGASLADPHHSAFRWAQERVLQAIVVESLASRDVEVVHG